MNRYNNQDHSMLRTITTVENIINGVGPDTIRSLAANGAKCLVLEAGRTIIIDKPQTLELANRMGVVVVGR